MPENKEVRLLVKKETFTFGLCSKCGGTGKPQSRARRNSNEPCFTCRGSGKEKLTHITEVLLMDALKELGLIK